MAFLLETTEQYDNTKYSPLGTVISSNVEGVSYFRAIMGAFQGAWGGKNAAIQTAVDRLTERGLIEFKDKVSVTYPNTIKVVGLRTSITEVGGEDSQTFLILHVSGTCLGPYGQTGGSLRRKKTLRRNRRKA